MSRIAGYIVRLSKEREKSFEHNIYETFSEPVPEFKHSRNIPLVCFLVNSDSHLTHIALGKRGVLAGTDLRKLNIKDFFKVDPILHSDKITSKSPKRLKKIIEKKVMNGGLLPPKSFEAFIQIIMELVPPAATVLLKYSEARYKRISSISSHERNILAEQKEAIATAMSIAGIDRGELQGWDNENRQTTSFLDGLEQVRLREDPMVINDLNKVPGFNAIKSTVFGSVVFENDKSKLTVILANRLPLEKQLGVDLIYYNETFSCFIMVQYKAMEKETEDFVYRFPNKQLTEEIDRMNQIQSELTKLPASTEADGFRLNENPFFIKICPRIVFDPDNVSLIKGMYLPLEYWGVLTDHPSMIGPRGGKRLSYKNVRRYFDNTSFISLASGGWVGTNIEQSKLLEKAIRSTLKTGRSVVFAVKTTKDLRHQEDS